MNDDPTIQFFSEFQALRHETAGDIRKRLLQHDDYKFPEEFHGLRSIVFSEMAGDFTRGLIGELNRFLINIHCADSLIRATNKYEEKMKAALLWEFADPFLEISIGRAYSIKNHFAFSTVHLLNQSNHFKDQNHKDELPEDRRITFEFLRDSKLGKDWGNFSKFLENLTKLNDQSFIEATRNSRNLIQHRFRFLFHTGLTTYFDRIENNGQVSYTYKLMPALKLDVLIPQLYKQHEIALKIFNAFWELMIEFFAEWTKPSSTTMPRVRHLNKGS